MKRHKYSTLLFQKLWKITITSYKKTVYFTFGFAPFTPVSIYPIINVAKIFFFRSSPMVTDDNDTSIQLFCLRKKGDDITPFNR